MINKASISGMTGQDSAQNNQSEPIDFVALWRVLWKYKYVIILIAGLFSSVAVVLALTATPVFRAEVTIAEAGDQGIGRSSPLGQLGGLAGLAGIDLGINSGGTANAVAILKSRKLVEEFITHNKVVPLMYPKAKQSPTLWFAVKDFRQHILSFREDKRNDTTSVAINWTDPVIAAQWANEFVAQANNLIRARAIEDSQRNVAYLRAQIEKTTVVELQKVMYSLIESETKTLMLASGRAEYAFTVVDPAVAPELRIRPQRTIMVLFGGATGLLVGVIAAFVLHRLRSNQEPSDSSGT